MLRELTQAWNQMQWTPGIGDPSILGWITVAAYLAASLRCTQVGLHKDRSSFWWWLALGLLALAINKQLDLQSFFTDFTKQLAIVQGWYHQRRMLQIAVISGIVVSIVALGIFCAIKSWGRLRERALVIAGILFLCAFVCIRALSFHQFDELIGTWVFGLKMNWIMELGGIALIIIGARRADLT